MKNTEYFRNLWRRVNLQLRRGTKQSDELELLMVDYIERSREMQDELDIKAAEIERKIYNERVRKARG